MVYVKIFQNNPENIIIVLYNAAIIYLNVFSGDRMNQKFSSEGKLKRNSHLQFMKKLLTKTLFLLLHFLSNYIVFS